jgi:hypothetical protein
VEVTQTPFPACWYGIPLPGYREYNATYRRLAYDSLPPLPDKQFHGDFRWLPEEPWSRKPGCGETEEHHRRWLARLNELLVDASRLGLELPGTFLQYMRSDLRFRLPSCTGCYYRWPDRIAESPKGGGHLLSFLADSQDCLVWYLYLRHTTNDHCVVVSWDFLGFDDPPEPQFPDDPDNVFFCAPSFEAFIYRFWIENAIWYALEKDKRTLSAEEMAYAEHCKRNSRKYG